MRMIYNPGEVFDAAHPTLARLPGLQLVDCGTSVWLASQHGSNAEVCKYLVLPKSLQVDTRVLE
jgi:hypothetical protein